VSWQEAVDCLEYTGHTAVVVFIFFIAFAYFAVLNVVTGVFCQSAIESTQHDREMVVQNVITNKKLYVEKIKQLFKGMDGNDDGCITLTEFEAHLEDEQVIAYFESLELATTDAWTLFKLLDQDKTNGIDIEEFVMGCIRVKGNARGIDMAKLIQENQWMSKRITTFMSETDFHFKSMWAVLNHLLECKSALDPSSSKPMVVEELFTNSARVGGPGASMFGLSSPSQRAVSFADEREPIDCEEPADIFIEAAHESAIQLNDHAGISDCTLVGAGHKSL